MVKAKLCITIADVKEYEKIDKIIDFAKSLNADVSFDDLDLSA